MQICDWGNVLVRHVCEWKHWKYSPWACPFRGRISWRFSLSKNNISPAAPDLELILFPQWYWPIMNAHTKQQQDKVFETDFINTMMVKNLTPHLCTIGTKSYKLINCSGDSVDMLWILLLWFLDLVPQSAPVSLNFFVFYKFLQHHELHTQVTQCFTLRF